MWNDYVSVPTTVRAVYWDGTDDVLSALTEAGCSWRYGMHSQELEIRAGVSGAQKFVPVPKGHYIICGAHPEVHFWPCDRDNFEHKYKAAHGT